MQLWMSKWVAPVFGALILASLPVADALAQPTCTITCQVNITKSNDPNQCGAVTTYSAPLIAGTCGTVTAIPASGSFYPKGTTTVTATASAGPSCTFTITVVDTQPPSITVPANITRQLTPQETSVVVNYGPIIASDNCPGVTAVGVPPSGSTFPLGTTTVTGTATDTSGNTATASFLIRVIAYIQVPTLGEYGLLLLALLLGAGAFWHRRKLRS